jgi:hypothetical protein
MNKYLEKIAANKEDEPKPINGWGKAGLGYLGASAGMFAAQPVSSHFTKKVMHEMDHEHGISNHGTVRKFMRDNNFNRHNMTLNHRDHVRENLGHLPPEYHALHQFHDSPAELSHPDTGHHMLLGTRSKKTGKLRNMDVMMHELGHAKDFSTHGHLKQKAQLFGNRMGNHAALAGVAAMSSEKTRDYAPLAAAVPGALVLRSEAMANYHAYHGIKAHKGAQAANKFLTHFVPKQMAGYVAGTMGPAAGLYGANKLIDYVHKKRGLDKESEFQKLAWDSDYEDKNEYGIAANRSIINPMVHDMLTKASKDPHVHVMVDEFSNRHHPEEFKKRLAEIKTKVPNSNREEHIKNKTMQWDRNHTWSMGMDKNDPVVKSYIGKEDKWGDEIERPEDAITHHLNKYDH